MTDLQADIREVYKTRLSQGESPEKAFKKTCEIVVGKEITEQDVRDALQRCAARLVRMCASGANDTDE